MNREVKYGEVVKILPGEEFPVMRFAASEFPDEDSLKFHTINVAKAWSAASAFAYAARLVEIYDLWRTE